MRLTPILLRALAVATLGGAMMPLRAQPPCQLCTPGSSEASAPARAVSIEITQDLDFGRAALNAGDAGTIAVDARTGQRRPAGLVDLGGSSFRGSAVIHGDPFRRVRVDLSDGGTMRAAQGATGELVDLRTDAPPVVTLDARGEYVLGFGGRFALRDGESGDFRGRISITADYE